MMKTIFIRFGRIPEGGRSKNNNSGEYEVGVSVYEAIERDGKVQILVPSLMYSACVSLSAFVGEKGYVVEGEVVGYGGDGEPLLRNCQVVREIGPEQFRGWDGGGAFGAREPYQQPNHAVE